ncbi:MAG: hypothetical protein NT001_07795 [Candidatus Woesearchaeota archaeon]|nr:hypothetical protein [Candidatus Woesearchaeota archaeon]
MMDINTTAPLLMPYLDTIHTLVNIAGVLVGGVFGFYIISFIWRIYSYKREKTMMKGFRHDLNMLTKSVARLEKKIDRMEKHRK